MNLPESILRFVKYVNSSGGKRKDMNSLKDSKEELYTIKSKKEVELEYLKRKKKSETLLKEIQEGKYKNIPECMR